MTTIFFQELNDRVGPFGAAAADPPCMKESAGLPGHRPAGRGGGRGARGQHPAARAPRLSAAYGQPWDPDPCHSDSSGDSAYQVRTVYQMVLKMHRFNVPLFKSVKYT